MPPYWKVQFNLAFATADVHLQVESGEAKRLRLALDSSRSVNPVEAGKPLKTCTAASASLAGPGGQASRSKTERPSAEKENRQGGRGLKTELRQQTRVQKSIVSPSHKCSPATESSALYGQSTVGKSCRIFWPDDQAWYVGKITSFDIKTGKHQVYYDDGDEEWLDLGKERIEFVPIEDIPGTAPCVGYF